MANRESNREDLLREAVALVRRAEYTVAGYDDPVVIGFRRDGAGSIYLGQDLVFQFNTDNAFRRGFRDGCLLKAEQGRLVQLTRQRNADEVVLLRHEFSDVETAEFLNMAQTQICRLRDQLSAGNYRLNGQVPESPDLNPHITKWLTDLQAGFSIAKTPGVGRK